MKTAYLVFGVLAFGASFLMFQVGSTSTHLSELKDYFLVPLPLGVILLGLGLKE